MVNGHATLLYYILAVKHNSVVFIQKFNALTFGLAFWKGSANTLRVSWSVSLNWTHPVLAQNSKYPNKTKTMLLVY